MHCQRATAEAIMVEGGDYVMAVKANQPALYDDVKLLMDDPAAPADDTAETIDADHGRIETRRAEVLHDVDWLTESHRWPGLAALGKVTATREIDGRATTTSRYYIASRPLSAADLNRLARARKDNAPENLALLRRLALNIIKRNENKGSNRIKFKRAGWDDKFIQSSLREWAYARAYENSGKRPQELPHWLHHYNWHRPHAGIKGKTPVSRSGLDVNNLMRLHI